MEPRYPRSRDETGPLPDQPEIMDLCKRFWDLEVTSVRRANSRCVFFCDSLRDGRVVFRVNPGWDGSTHPKTIVAFVRHLADRGAPCPDIRPTTDGGSWRGTFQSGLPQMMNVPHSPSSSRPTMPSASASSTGNGVRSRLIGEPGDWKTEYSLSRMRRFVWARLQSKA